MPLSNCVRQCNDTMAFTDVKSQSMKFRSFHSRFLALQLEIQYVSVRYHMQKLSFLFFPGRWNFKDLGLLYCFKEYYSFRKPWPVLAFEKNKASHPLWKDKASSCTCHNLPLKWHYLWFSSNPVWHSLASCQKFSLKMRYCIILTWHSWTHQLFQTFIDILLCIA